MEVAMPETPGGGQPANPPSDDKAERGTRSGNDEADLKGDTDELSEDEEPGTGEVIRTGEPLGTLRRQQNLILIVVLALLVGTIVFDLFTPILVSTGRWSRAAPEVDEIRKWMFATVGGIVGV